MEIRGAVFEADFEAEEYLQLIRTYSVTWTNIFIYVLHVLHVQGDKTRCIIVCKLFLLSFYKFFLHIKIVILS